MTPLKKAPGCTSLLVERQKKVVVENGAKGDTHVAGGAHQGLVINKREGGMQFTMEFFLGRVELKCLPPGHRCCGSASSAAST
jgi:hypothetical protein